MDETALSPLPLFHGLTPAQLRGLLPALRAREGSVPKNTVILHAGDTARSMGLVLSGGVRVELDDAWGNKSVLSHIGPGGLFAETYACLSGQPLLVSAVAAQDSRLLFLDARALLDPADPVRAKVLANLLRISMRKNLELSRRILHTAPKTIRGRLLSYLSEQALLACSDRFTIPFNRQQLADYLGVDRSALSHQLSLLRREGVLSCRGSAFSLATSPAGQGLAIPREIP